MGFENLPETTADLAQEQMAKLRALFPECVTEGQDGLTVDFDLLRRALSPEKVVEGPNERYRLEWPGKRTALCRQRTHGLHPPPRPRTLQGLRHDAESLH